MIAFLTHVEQICGAEARFLHLGLTSSDLLDTTLAIQLERASDLILVQIDTLLEALERRAYEHKLTPTIGRSHGIHAEPTSFGLKLAGHFAEFTRGRRRMVQGRYEIMTCAMSGAVGTFANLDPRVELMVAERFGLRPEPVSTQVIPRDRHAAFTAALALLAASIERLATEIRHLQRSEVGEAEEPFAVGQKGSSAMPHKRNPVLSENLTGLARMVRAAIVPALENVALWHERDISHSSVERVMLPDACILTDFALSRLARLVEGLVVYPERMRRNLDASQGLYSSQRVLLALTEAGLPRQEAYEMVQRHAMIAWREGRPLLDLLRADPTITARVDETKLARCSTSTTIWPMSTMCSSGCSAAPATGASAIAIPARPGASPVRPSVPPARGASGSGPSSPCAPPGNRWSKSRRGPGSPPAVAGPARADAGPAAPCLRRPRA